MPRETDRPTYEVVGRIGRFDERDSVFSRESLEHGSVEEAEYYTKNPHLRETDTKIRAFIQRRRGERRASWRTAYYRGTFNPIAYLAFPSCVEGEPLSPQLGASEEQNSDLIKSLGYYLGADIVRIGPLREEWVYTNRGTPPFFKYEITEPPFYEGIPQAYTGLGWGDEIKLTHRNAIVLGFAQDFRILKCGAGAATDLEVGRVYAKSALVACQVASFIRSIGYPARAHHVRNYGVLVVPIAVDAGLGELGRCGYLVSYRYGTNLRLSCVTTDMPLAHDGPVDIGIQDFCNKCLKCALNCPAGAIPTGEKTEVRGVLKWKVDAEKCLLYWNKIDAACTICQIVCPWSKPPTLFHRSIAWLASNFPWIRKALVAGDDIVYGRKFRPKVRPSWIVEDKDMAKKA